jgi:DNA (cytosine-5)-methyltransferase 1
MVGFKDPSTPFLFPEKRELAYTMSDVMKGKVDREIGFTLRVGGGSSPIEDRRNWDGYIVDGLLRRISPEEGKKLQGFPDDFVFPVSRREAMKQLGNSVAINAIQDWAEELIKALDKQKNKK